MIIRPVESADLSALLNLARESGPGMTNFTDNAISMSEKIEQSCASFSKDILQADNEYYFFVLEDTENKKIAGCCGIYSTVGIHKPFYSFRVLSLTHSSLELKYYEPVRVLQMVEEHRGFAEIVSLYLTPEYRKDGNGKFLSRSRFLYMGEFPQRFPEYVIAEMRGKVDGDGQSAFWNSLGGHFFPMNFIEADQFNALGHFQFIADMMPKAPIYIRLLPKKAQQMIGQTHEHTIPALNMLQREGFRTDGCVDVFDAGPVIKCPNAQIKTVLDSQHSLVNNITEIYDSPLYMVCNCQTQNVRIARGHLTILDNKEISLDHKLAEKLNVTSGDAIRFVKV